jgi:uncharacterized protein with HEPN domain
MRSRRERRDDAYLSDMLVACTTIVERTQRRQLPDLASDGEFRDGVVLQLIMLGEAASHLTDEARKRYPGAAWREVIGLRNLLIHKYWVVDHLKIWEYVRTDVPALLHTLAEEKS